MMQVGGATGAALADMVRLHALAVMEEDLAWLMAERLVPLDAGAAVPRLIR